MPYTPTPYKIESIKELTKDVKLFRVKCNLNPRPGQFLQVSIPGIGECPLASCSYNNEKIDLLARNAGNVTSALFQLKKEDKIFIRGPYGRGFHIEALKNHNLIMIAGGTGIAPVTSLIDYVEKNKKDFKKIFIYFGFRNQKYVLLKDRIKKWKKEFNLYIGLSDKIIKKTNEENFNYEIGFVQDIMEKHKPETENTIALLCGPEPMMNAVTNELNKLGIKNNKIYWSMERRMECGFGNCGRCLIQDVYVCKDGPVFRYDFIKPRIDNENSNNRIEIIPKIEKEKEI
jgi:anaerobic sulfite reductase subunit B